ncbi:MAG: hypothetical protein A2X51_00075 [Candidatus Rokubacteria bacterium GWC2_70_24]|nr:MAG: hypothetical protein A2X53_19360 [Candidatus Rokubacteria bacterium GWA2_70_23]OGK88232.1 MAG: hypothetical protein A2X51_00075 [Candidatus Rokubacteria bacterium GWC2_70_24]
MGEERADDGRVLHGGDDPQPAASAGAGEDEAACGFNPSRVTTQDRYGHSQVPDLDNTIENPHF